MEKYKWIIILCLFFVILLFASAYFEDLPLTNVSTPLLQDLGDMSEVAIYDKNTNKYLEALPLEGTTNPIVLSSTCAEADSVNCRFIVHKVPIYKGNSETGNYAVALEHKISGAILQIVQNYYPNHKGPIPVPAPMFELDGNYTTWKEIKDMPLYQNNPQYFYYVNDTSGGLYVYGLSKIDKKTLVTDEKLGYIKYDSGQNGNFYINVLLAR